MLVFLLILTFVKQDSEQSIRPSKTQCEHNLNKEVSLRNEYKKSVNNGSHSVVSIGGRFISDWQGFNLILVSIM